jgi:hypothetical protein
MPTKHTTKERRQSSSVQENRIIKYRGVLSLVRPCFFITTLLNRSLSRNFSTVFEVDLILLCLIECYSA